MPEFVDLTIIVIYLAVVLGAAAFLGWRENLEGFLVNNRRTRTFLLVGSLVSTTFGAGALIGVAGAAYLTGISFGITTIVTVVSGFVLLAIMAPKIKRFGDKFQAHTIGDFFAKRFSRRAQILVSSLTIIAFFIFTGAQLVAIASLASVFIGLDFTTTLFGASIIAILYAAMAGLKGDIYTDFIQFLVMIIALFAALLPFGVLKFGFPANLPAGHFDLFAFAGPIFFFGGIFLGGLYLTASMDWWQRIYASQNPKQARRIFWWAAVVSIPFYLLAIGLGLMAAGFLGPGTDPDTVLFRMMDGLLPAGLLGLGYAGILAAVMSSVDSMIVVSTASAFKDFYKTLINPKTSSKKEIKYARLFALAFGAAGLIAAFALPDIVDLVLISVFVIATFIPATLAGIFWKGATERGAFWGTLAGFLVLITFLPLVPRLAWVPSLAVSAVLLLVMSKATEHSPEEKIPHL